ncbi:MAG TPA: FdhF/YdeP family oxidoreductase [Candidatus Acidoferrum sp.]|nr:FdhF/YdeP family oxidoreductase [Candidatus Acidoferrum sp.]
MIEQKNLRRDVLVEPPVELQVTAKAPPTVATGLPAVVHSMEVAFENEGPLRATRTMLKINQRGGFDCPSCAWADPEGPRHTAEFCENGAKAMADDATRRRIDAAFFAKYSVEELSRQSDHWLNAQGRLTEPMVLRPNSSHYEPIAWDDAFELIADEMNRLESPDEAVFYTSGKAINESAFLFQLFARMFGTNNMPDCSNMCHESSGSALSETLGVGKSTVTLSDLEKADCILVIGQNPGTNHPRMLSSLQKAKRNGATMISINPLREAGLTSFRHPQELLGLLGVATKLSDHFLQVRINGDLALLRGFSKALLEREDGNPGSVLDRTFIETYTDGFDAYAASVRATPWDEIVESSGIPEGRIREIAEILAEAKGLVVCWAMGLTQHKNAVPTIRELVNVTMLRGNIGRPGAGLLCVRGHSNVQGDRTMGIFERMDDGFLDRLGAEFDFNPPRKHGYDTVAAIQAMIAGKVKAFISLGGNFLSATPDTHRVAEGLSNTNLSVSIATKLNRGHLVTGRTALILPCLTRTEKDEQASGLQFGTVENTVSEVSASRGFLPPTSPNVRSEPAIVAGMAAATLRGKHALDWNALVANYDRIRDHASRVVSGFEKFNERVRSSEPFYAPVGPKERVFPTASGRANFTVNPISTLRIEPDQYIMMTIRTHDQFNTVVYGLDDRYRGIFGGRRVIFLNRDDIAAAGLREGELVDITSHFNGERRTVEQFRIVGYDIPSRCAATYYPETNPLVPLESKADISGTPTSKSVIISLSRSALDDRKAG